MSTELKVPQLPESVADATVMNWYKKPGDSIKRDENLVDLETDKVVLEVPAPFDGILEKIVKNPGEKVQANEVLAMVNAQSVSATAAPAEKAATPASAPISAPAATAASPTSKQAAAPNLSPATRRLIGEHELDASKITGSGPGGRITSADVTQFMQGQPAAPVALAAGARPEERVPMTRLRARIAERLLQAQHNAAMLTTFNEINLRAVNELRGRYKDLFEKKYGVRLGFMSFFAKAAIEALKQFPAVNASIDGADIVYHGYYDIGIAVSTERGLVVPVLRDVDQMSMSAIEKQIGEYANRARDGKLTLEEMTGGTFTITNGGVFGSLLATPILNPPQSAILGMHKIEDRPVVENGQIVIRPMMYVALTYDHRIIDGRESVQFLVKIKEFLEDPSRLLLEV